MYSKVDYIRNGIYNSTLIQFALLLEEGLPLPQLTQVTKDMQAAIHRAFLKATETAALDLSGAPDSPPTFGQPPEGPEPTENPFRC